MNLNKFFKTYVSCNKNLSIAVSRLHQYYYFSHIACVDSTDFIIANIQALGTENRMHMPHIFRQEWVEGSFKTSPLNSSGVFASFICCL